MSTVFKNLSLEFASFRKPSLTHVAEEPLVMNLSATRETSSDMKNSMAVGTAVKIPAFDSSISKLSFMSFKP